jgi:outer membrane protein OmpA-like peptidoglycan-associated protein
MTLRIDFDFDKATIRKAEEAELKKADISTVGYGESKPVADNKTSKGRFENRGAEIFILEK